MRSTSTLLLACFVLLFSNCDNSVDPEAYTARSTTLDRTESADSIPIPPVVTINARDKDGAPAPPDMISAKIDAEVEAEIARQLKIDPDLPEYTTVSEAYDNITVQVFSGIASATGGETYMIDNAALVVGAITEIIHSYMTAKTDLVFLIDKTGSMSDDILKIRNSVTTIIDAIEPFEDARVGFAFYGDKNVDENWYHLSKLTDDFSACKEVIKHVTTTGGGDGPESVYDGIALTLEKMNWDADRRRMILLIGDAPALEKPLSDYDLYTIIGMTKEADVTMNFYPVVIGIKGTLAKAEKVEVIKTSSATLISSLNPNPATNLALLKTDATGDYSVEIFDISGKLIDSKKFHDNNIPIYTDSYPTGVYIVRLLDLNEHTVDTRKLVVKR